MELGIGVFGGTNIEEQVKYFKKFGVFRNLYRF